MKFLFGMFAKLRLSRNVAKEKEGLQTKSKKLQ